MLIIHNLFHEHVICWRQLTINMVQSKVCATGNGLPTRYLLFEYVPGIRVGGTSTFVTIATKHGERVRAQDGRRCSREGIG